MDIDAAGGAGETLTKQRIVKHLSARIGFNHREAKEIVDLFLQCICDALARGEAVRLSGFGVFRLRDKRERPGRNPRTGQAVQVAARRVVTFRAGQDLRRRIGGMDEKAAKAAAAPSRPPASGEWPNAV